MKYVIFLIAAITLSNCHGNKHGTTHPADPNDRFSVSFISIGAGTDGSAKEKFDQFITEYKQENKVELKYETINWGREGEVDYCFDLTSLDKKKQELFIAETKEILKTSTLVRYKENEPCQQK